MVDIRSPQITVARQLGGALVVALDGEIDTDTRPVLAAGLREAVGTVRPPKVVVVDLSAVTFFAAAGLRLLIEFDALCRRRGLPIRLVVRPGGTTARVIEIAGLAARIPTFGTRDQAVRARVA